MKTILFRRIIFKTSLIIISFCFMQNANTQTIIHTDNWSQTELSTEQSERYAKVIKQLLRGQNSNSPLAGLASQIENVNFFNHFAEADLLNNLGEGQLRKVRIDAISELEGNRIEVDIPTSFCENITFKGKSVKFNSDDDFSWYGELEPANNDACSCKSGYLLLMAKNGEKFGQLTLEDEHYAFEWG